MTSNVFYQKDLLDGPDQEQAFPELGKVEC